MLGRPLRLLLVPALAIALLAAGCGGDSSSSNETMSPTDWANGVCGAITTWTSSLTSATDSLKGGNISKESLQSATDDVESSTKTFTEDLKDLGKPDTETGQQAKDLLDGLDDDLNADVEEIQTTVDSVSGVSDVLSAVSDVSGTLGKMGQQVSSTFSQLDQLDTSKELEQAFQDAGSCDQLQSAGG